MKSFHRSSNPRGEFSLGTLIFTLVIIAVIVICIKYAQAYADKAKVEAMLTQTILSNKDNPANPDIAERVATGTKQLTGSNVNGGDIVIYLSTDTNHMRIELSYYAPIRLMGFGWDQKIDAATSEILHYH